MGPPRVASNLWAAPGDVLGPSGRLLGVSCGPLGRSWAPGALWASRGVLGPPWALPGLFWGPSGGVFGAFWAVLSGPGSKTWRSTEPRKTHGIYCILRGFGEVGGPPRVAKRLWKAPCRVHEAHVGVHRAQVGVHRAPWEPPSAICTALPSKTGPSETSGTHANQVTAGPNTYLGGYTFD